MRAGGQRAYLSQRLSLAIIHRGNSAGKRPAGEQLDDVCTYTFFVVNILYKSTVYKACQTVFGHCEETVTVLILRSGLCSKKRDLNNVQMQYHIGVTQRL